MPSREMIQKLILSIGTHRGARPLSPIEVANALASLEAEGIPRAKIAALLQLKDGTMIGRFLRLRRLAAEVQHMVDWGTTGLISLSIGTEVARLPSSDHEQAVSAIIQNGFTRDEIRELIQVRLRSGQSLNECIAAVLRLRPEIVKRHVYIGTVDEPRLSSILSDMSQLERDALLRQAVEHVTQQTGTWSGHLGTSRFVVAGDEDFGRAMASIGDRFAAEILLALREVVTHG